MTRPQRLTPGLLAALGLLAAIGPLATDFYLSSFAEISRDLGVGASAVQLTLTGFLIGIAIGQLILGPTSDRFGRRPVLVISMAVFAVISIAIALAPTIQVMIALRVLHGIFGAAGIVIARAIAADLSEGKTAVRALSLIAMVAALGPIVAPIIGGGVAATVGWRGALWTLATLAVGLFLIAFLVIPESLPIQARHSGGVGAALRQFGSLLRDRAFAGYLLAFALGYGAMMAYISASPFVVQSVLGFGIFAYSMSYATSAAALILSNFTNSRIAPRFMPTRMLRVGQLAAIAAATALLIVTVAGILNLGSLIALAFILTAGTGFTMANSSALALARTPTARGSGSALLGATQFGLGALVAPLTGAWGGSTAVPMVIVMTVCAVIGFILSRTLTGRRRPAI